MASVQMKRLTIVPKTDSEEKPALSPTGSVDSGVNFDSPTSPGQTMTSRDFANHPTAARGAREQTAESPITAMINGYPIDAAELETMGRALIQARANGEFPRTTTPSYDIQATLDDYARLVRLREARGDAPRSEWPNMRNATNLLINITRDIRNRDELRGDQAEATTVQNRIANMMQGVHGEANLYRLVQHAVHHSIQNQAVQQDLAAGGHEMAGILSEIRDRIEHLATEGRHGVNESNMEDVLEEVFGMIEHALIDAAGPIRLNANRLDTISDANQAHVNAISQHVNAIGGYVNALSTNMSAMSNNLNSTAGNVQAMTTQVGVLQTFLGMLPQMVTQAVQDILPQALQEAVAPTLAPIILARLQERMGAMKGGVSGKNADCDSDEKHTKTEKTRGQHKKKSSFFKRFFSNSKRGGIDDGAGASGLCF
ncbi:hypothetical protein DL766_000814 [Monosporascus sp. MC13-8B]|uniref:Uncharacterized protein n=1 Tax=Monosporascus cannonballus TaxID=155416 RepID=A0ABY0HHC8_9PEZI|nr:hypothetical protein DL762_001123 [Monosporascus cannonballus]RYO98400.1 hypothetical protein DL763_002239 [Monosporascus cannonballus]RYP38814.1 hypothetical protein DL766_000814 [Monosporascus sp. MC13-8B]